MECVGVRFVRQRREDQRQEKRLEPGFHRPDCLFPNREGQTLSHGKRNVCMGKDWQCLFIVVVEGCKHIHKRLGQFRSCSFPGLGCSHWAPGRFWVQDDGDCASCSHRLLGAPAPHSLLPPC